MKQQVLENKYSLVGSLVIVYALVFSLVIPSQIRAEKNEIDSSFNQKSPRIEQNKTPVVEKSFGNTPVYFEENQGQFNKRVKYFARGSNGYSLFLTATEAVYVLMNSRSTSPDSSKSETQNPTSQIKNGVAVYMELVGANKNSQNTGIEQMLHKTNYFKGEESDWRTGIPNFKKVRINNVYQGIDTVWHGRENGVVQYDFIVKPNANPNQIEWEIKGADSVEIDEKGDLLIKTEQGTIRQQKPFTFQKDVNGLTQEIESHFKLNPKSEIGNPSSVRVSFEVGTYDRNRTLTIDPTVNLSNLSFSTFLGGAESDVGEAIAVDKAGNVYVTGKTESITFPATPGTFDPTHNDNGDVFVTKLNASGSALIYSTFLGGREFDQGNDIVVDASGNAFVVGQTDNASSIDYPTTTGAFDETHNGVEDVFVTKLNVTGSVLEYSTFIGSDALDRGFGIAIDTSGNAYVTGEILTGGSVDYPTTTGAFDETPNGNFDAFVTKLNATGSALEYSTFLGGSVQDRGYDIEVDASGNAYVVGQTSDGVTDFPTTFGAFDETHNGSSDVFVTKLNVAGSGLDYSTFIGGSLSDIGNGIAIDTYGNAFITGNTVDGATDYPTTSGAFDTTLNGSNDVFVSKLNSTGTGFEYSTFIGGSSIDEANDIAIDSYGNAFIVGETNDGGTDYPTTTGAFDETQNGMRDAFVTKLNPAGSGLRYSTYIGESSTDVGNGIAIDTSGNIFITGETRGETAFPTTDEVFQSENNGDDEAFVTKFGDFSLSGRTVDTSGNPLSNTAVALGGDTDGFMLSDSDGYFYFGDTRDVTPLTGNYIVGATKNLYAFNPPNYQVEVNRNKRVTFVGNPVAMGPTAAFADLGGKVQTTVGNAGLPFARLTLIDTVSGDTAVVTTDANGDYEFEEVLTGNFYLVVAEREGYNFAPQIHQVNHFGDNLNLDFLATPNAPRPVLDFDGDGKTDLSVFRPEEGNWYILQTQDNSLKTVQFGVNGDIPVASDYDGDEKADIAVYRPTEGNWYRLNSSNGEFKAIHFGTSGDISVPADFDGDGKTDLAVYRPSTGVWHRLNSTDGRYYSIKFGISTDQPIAADYDSDGKADLTVFRDGTWYRLRSIDSQVQAFQFGIANDKPLAVDFDGDGRMDTAVYRPSNGAWYWLESSDGDFHAKQFGIETDIPTPADYNGDGRYEQSVFRNGIWYVLRHDNSFYSAPFGLAGDVPIPAVR